MRTEEGKVTDGGVMQETPPERNESALAQLYNNCVNEILAKLNTRVVL